MPEILETTGVPQYEPIQGYWPRDFIGDEGTYDAPWYRIWRWYLTRPVSATALLEFHLGSPADLHVYDPLGRHVGINYTTGEPEVEIPNATISITDGQSISVLDPIQGDYKIEVAGKEDGSYDLRMFRIAGEHVTYQREHNDVSIFQNQTDRYIVSNPITWTGEIVRSPPGGPATDAVSNTFTLNESYNYTLYVENKGLSGIKMFITNATGSKHKSKHKTKYKFKHKYTFKGDKEYFGKIAQGTLEAGDYTISLIPHGKKGASVKFVLNVGG